MSLHVAAPPVKLQEHKEYNLNGIDLAMTAALLDRNFGATAKRSAELRVQKSDNRPAGDRPATEAELAEMASNSAVLELPIERETFYRQAHPETTPDLIRVDVELARIANGLHKGNLHRIWVYAHSLDKAGRGVVSRAELHAYLISQKVKGIANERRYIRDGNGLYWHVVGDRLYLRSKQNVAHDLAQIALEVNPDLVETNLPGDRADVWIVAGGSLQDWEIAVLHGWLYSRGCENWRKAEYHRARKAGDNYQPGKENPFIKIKPKTLGRLFGRCERIIKYWLKALRESGAIYRSNPAYAQAPLDGQFAPPKGAWEYMAKTSAGEQIRYAWRIPSTLYICHRGIREHGHRGQAGQVRAASLSAVQPDDNANRAARYRRYCWDGDHLDRLTSKHGGATGNKEAEFRYLYLGKNRFGHEKWEPCNHSIHHYTDANERVSFARERELSDVLQ